MDGIGAEVSQKIRSAIKAKLTEIGVYVDEELPDYVMVMVANKRSKEQMDDELQLFLGKHTSLFTTWLHHVLQKLQEVTVANLGVIKKKVLSNETKRKKKHKSGGEKKELKKKIKTEPVEDSEQEITQSATQSNKEVTDSGNKPLNDGGSTKSQGETETEHIRKEKKDYKSSEKPAKERKISTSSIKSSNQHGESLTVDDLEDRNESPATNSQSEHSEVDEFDDGDCINIRTDGELLDTAEEANGEEPVKQSKDNHSKTISTNNKSTDKKKTENHKSKIMPKEKSTENKRQKSRSPTPPTKSVKVFDARDVLNRRKAANQVVDSKSRDRKRSVDKGTESPDRKRSNTRDNSRGHHEDREHSKRSAQDLDRRSDSPTRKRRSESPTRKRRSDTKDNSRGHNEDRNQNKRSAQVLHRSESPARKRRSDTRENGTRGRYEERNENKRSGQFLDKESYNHKNKRDNNRYQKDECNRGSYLAKRGEDRSRRNDSRNSWNKSDVRNPARNDSDEWNPSNFAAKMSELFQANQEVDSSGRSRDSEEPRKRIGVLSQVVLRSPEPEEIVENPLPSVVRVTPRPRRLPSQQPSSTLIMKAISEANRSLANVPPRPDSTQQSRKKPVLTRTVLQREKIPRAKENIAISINNPLALQNVENNSKPQEKKAQEEPGSPKVEKPSNKESPKHDITEENTLEPDNTVQNDNLPNDEEWTNKEPEILEEEPQQEEEIQQPVFELNVPSSLEPCDEPMEESSDPQFVVTLNGYDPDGLYSHSELDLGEGVEEEEWVKDTEDDPMLTSTPDMNTTPRPLKQRLGSPIVQMSQPAVNHSNLIPVEIMKGKTTERCKYWPACRLEDKCTFYHPTKPCNVFPACKFGDACLYIHPQCKFNSLCTRKDCIFAHTPVHTPLQPQASPNINKTLYATSAPLPCKFYPNCANANCQFAHPLRTCRYGLYCTKKDCSFEHGQQVAPVEKLKWSRGSTTT